MASPAECTPAETLCLDDTRAATDHKSYRYIVLPNRMRALLISECGQSPAAASARVTSPAQGRVVRAVRAGVVESKVGGTPASGSDDDESGSVSIGDDLSDGGGLRGGGGGGVASGAGAGAGAGGAPRRPQKTGARLPSPELGAATAATADALAVGGLRAPPVVSTDFGGSAMSVESEALSPVSGGMSPAAAKKTAGRKSSTPMRVYAHNGITEMDLEVPLREDTASLDSQSLDSDDGSNLASGADSPTALAHGLTSPAPRKRVHKAALAVAVRVGSFSDPEHLGGLAHFLEHMLFMGSDKYPSENEYDSYISDHGGYTNAFTECEYTCYHFDVNADHLQPAMDRLARFFVGPLLRAEAAEREVRSVNSEFDQARTNDTARLDEVRRELSRKGHPNHKFGWGNVKSLEEDPAAAGIDVRKELLAFHRQYYSANTMVVVVRGSESVDELEAMVCEAFKDVHDRRVFAPTFERAGMPFADADLPRLVRVPAVRDVHVMTLTWCLPSLLHKYKTKPDDYLGHLIGHEARGSILYLLKQRGLATGLTAGVSDDGAENSTAAALFQVSVHLSEAGFANWVAVGEVVFQFLAILRGITRPPSWVYQEVAKMARQRYNYGDDEDPNDQVVRLASNMVSGVIPPADTLIATSLHGEEFNPEEVTELMALLTVDRVHVDLMSSKFKHDETLDRTEPWFGTKYCTSALPEDVVAAWREPKACPSLGLPCPNPFLPSNLTVLPLVTRLDPKLLEVATDGCGGPVPRRFRVPVRIHHDDTGKLWWHQDRIFRLPRGNVHYFFYCPEFKVSAQASAYAALYLAIVTDALNDTSYHAYLAELDYGLSGGRFGVHLSFSGFTEKMPRLAESVMTRLASGEVLEDRFVVVQEQVLRGARNRLISATRHSAYQRLLCLRSKSVEQPAFIAALEACTLADLRAYAKRMFRGCFTEALVHGNFTPEGALAMFALASKVTPASAAPPAGDSAEVVDPWGDIDRDRAWHFKYGGPTTPTGPRTTERFFQSRVATPRRATSRHDDDAGSGGGGGGGAGAGGGGPRRYGSDAPGSSDWEGLREHKGFVYPDDPIIRLHRGKRFLRRVRATKDDDVNSAVECYFQLGRESLELRAGVDLLEHVLQEPAYDALRTKEQLGYHVRVSARLTGCVAGFGITVQSAEYTCEHVHSRINAFLSAFRKQLVDMPRAKFEAQVAELVTLKLTADAALSEQTDRWWSEITARRYDFRSPEREAAALRSMTLAQLVNLYDAAFSSTKTRQLVVYVVRAMESPVGETRRRLASHDATSDSDDSDDGGKVAERRPRGADAADADARGDAQETHGDRTDVISNPPVVEVAVDSDTAGFRDKLGYFTMMR